jgi:hypothetical protein
MDDRKFRSQTEVLSVVDKGRRREWTDAENVRMVEESLGGYRQCAATEHHLRLSTTSQPTAGCSTGPSTCRVGPASSKPPLVDCRQTTAGQ